MSYVLLEHITKSFNDRVILDDVSFSIEKGDKVALVAQNGTGKSTLLNIIAGNEAYEAGLISNQKGIRIAFLAQEPVLNLDHTVTEELFQSDSPIIKAVRLYEECLQTPEDLERMELAINAMNDTNAWEYEERIKEILEKLNLHTLDTKLSTFSGGQKKRVALAKILIDTPDFLIMDEPTNHLDLEMIDWLETYLKDQDITFLMVTHDRYFLERVCNQIIELNNQKIYSYKGNYSYFLEKKESRETNENTTVDKTKALLRKELEWVRKGPSGRQAKGGARVKAYYDTKANIGKKNSVEKVSLDVVQTYLGSKILDIYNLTKSFGNKKILENFTYSFKKGEKVGIIGKNGVGKSTFVNIIMEQENFDSGKIVKGESVTFGYYTQTGLEYNKNEKVIDSVKAIAQYIKLSDGSEISAARMLERFLFTPEKQQTFIEKLSGGERKRLSILHILMGNPNFLILDEPTNDFDILTLNVLEDFLLSFNGCLIIVSHDRYFMDKVVDHLFVFKGNGIIQNFPGNYSDYREQLKESEPVIKTDPKPVEVNTTTKTSPKEQELYKEISKIEKKIQTLTEKINTPNLAIDKLTKLSIEIGALEKQLELKTDEWLVASS